MGASGKRTHIFWQRRIRQGDTTTPYWFPCKTDAGMMREDRLVLPIPPGVHWKDPMPVLLPTAGVPEAQGGQKALPSKRTDQTAEPPRTPTLMPPTRRRVQFGPVPTAPAPEPAGGVVKKDKSAKPKREKVKADPRLIAAARELRDRYLEQFNAGMVLPRGKYAVGRELSDATSATPRLLLPAA